jgi:4-hydroxy-2-oxoheptanedioate aldolase
LSSTNVKNTASSSKGHGNLHLALAEHTCFGTFLKLPRPEVVDLLALAGFDFVICDMEHAQITEVEARTVIKACAAVGLPVTVRLPEPTQGVVNRLLEAGAVGIQMPRLRSASDARNLHTMMHFPPEGSRSVGNANAWAGYGSVPIPQYLQESDARALVIGQFETREIEEPIDAMMQNLDVAFIGPMDLSVDFGVPGQFDHPDVAARIRQIEDAAARTDTFMGAFVGSIEKAGKLAAQGYRYLAVSGDIGILGSGAKNMVNSLHEAEAKANASTA